MSLPIVAVIVLLAALALGALAASVDHRARATAWRQIALERRWNREHDRRW